MTCPFVTSLGPSWLVRHRDTTRLPRSEFFAQTVSVVADCAREFPREAALLQEPPPRVGCDLLPCEPGIDREFLAGASVFAQERHALSVDVICERDVRDFQVIAELGGQLPARSKGRD